MKSPLEILIEERQPMELFINAQLDEFKRHLATIGLKPTPLDHRLRGAEQFAEWLLGHARHKGELSKRRRR